MNLGAPCASAVLLLRWIPVVVPPKDVRDGVLRGIAVAQLFRPLDALAAVRAGPSVLVLAVARGLVVLVAAPDAPAFGADVRAEVAADERHRCIGPPGSSEVCGIAFAGELAIEEDQSERRFLRRCRGGDVAAILAVDLAPLEDRR